MASSLPHRLLGSLGVLVASLVLTGGFVTSPAPNFKHVTRRETPLNGAGRRAPAGGPPDDFIDTTAVEVPGSESVGVDFERQELRVIFETMDRNNIFYKMLAEEQILCQSSKMKGKWKLDFSTEERYKLLPPTADIFNYIYDTSPSPNGGGQGRLDNVIRFYKSWIVKSVRAVTKYEMDNRGKIVFAFDRIEADILGFKVPLPKFNSDAGFIEVQYFDGNLWIEAFEADTTMTESGKTTVVNIYRRIGDATEEDKTSIPERTGEQRQPQR